MSKQPESHYNLNKLHIIFAILSLVLLMALGGVFKKDYVREWKKYQKDFRTFEIEKSRMKYDSALNDLNNNPEFLALIEEIESEQNTYKDSCKDLQDITQELKRLNTENDLVNQEYKFRKTALDVTKFKYESALAHKSDDLDRLTKENQALTEEVNALDLKRENFATDLAQKQSLIDKCEEKLISLQRKQRKLATERDLIQRKLDKIDPNEMSFINRIANMVRNLPILDLSNPSYKVEQIVLKDITDDVVITQIPKVDRCISCHQGIADPAYIEAPQPFTTHPNLDLFLKNDSAHPMEEFGCTVCHNGRGRGTSFNSAAHTPSSHEEELEWKEKYDWHEMHHWDKPMLPSQYTQAGCYKCHDGVGDLAGADKLNYGLKLIERAGCYNCHVIDQYEDWPKTGPSLRGLKGKLSKQWAWKWINNPHAFRKNTWMPAYYHLDNNDDPESTKRGYNEIHAMVHFLFEQSEDYTSDKFRFKGNIQNGEELVKSIGCLACHQVDPDLNSETESIDILRRQHGPNLVGLGDKTTKEWIFEWLKNPNRYHPNTRMPDLRLTDQEAADITEYLYQNNPEADFKNEKAVQMDMDIVNDITLDFLSKSLPMKQAKEKLDSMSQNDRLYYSGEKLISRYGCYSCHDIKGFENVKPIGIELTEEGDKATAKLDFGFIEIEHSKHAWFKQKIQHPRSFDQFKVKKPLEKLIMPQFYLDDQEAEAIVTALLGFVNNKTVQKKRPLDNPLNAGNELIRQLNCQSCHILNDQGGSIREPIKNWLTAFENFSDTDADKYLDSYSPPDIGGIGAKVNPQWLFEFLHQPGSMKIRPWLAVRMPTYRFNSAHLNLLVDYFNEIDDAEYPFQATVDTSLTKDEFQAAQKLFSEEYFQCTQCHVVDGKMPSGSPETWAPDLGWAQTRLRPQWTFDWIQNPQAIKPGTKMPTFYDPETYSVSGPEDILNGDEDAQIKALRNYLMTLHPENTSKASDRSEKTLPAQTEATKPDILNQNLQTNPSN